MCSTERATYYFVCALMTLVHLHVPTSQNIVNSAAKAVIAAIWRCVDVCQLCGASSHRSPQALVAAGYLEMQLPAIGVHTAGAPPHPCRHARVSGNSDGAESGSSRVCADGMAHRTEAVPLPHHVASIQQPLRSTMCST